MNFRATTRGSTNFRLAIHDVLMAAAVFHIGIPSSQHRAVNFPSFQPIE
jgi:hypothetical protein